MILSLALLIHLVNKVQETFLIMLKKKRKRMTKTKTKLQRIMKVMNLMKNLKKTPLKKSEEPKKHL
jgi:hypothetical protein